MSTKFKIGDFVYVGEEDCYNNYGLIKSILAPSEYGTPRYEVQLFTCQNSSRFQKLSLVTLYEDQIEPGNEHIEKEIQKTERKLNELQTIKQFSDKDNLAVFLGVKEPKEDYYV